MRKILIIGIGAGNPDYLTIQAVKALNEVDVFFIMDKGAEKSKLIDLRKEICRQHIKGDDYRFIDATSPEWDRKSDDYVSAVDSLNADKRAIFERLIADGLQEGECGAFLVWGDPTLYDSTIRILQMIAEAGVPAFHYEVIPGISAVQALAARHKTPLNRIGQSVEITTGRQIAAGFPDAADSVVVMLDGDNTYRRFADQDLEIYWGAYLGTPDEILISGRLKDVAGEIEAVRAHARRENGWIMDTYLMRRRDVD